MEQEAYKLIEKVTEKNQNLSKGQVYLKNRDFELAKECYLKVLNVEPDNVQALFGMLMCNSATSDTRTLLEYYISLYSEDKSEKVQACTRDDKMIEEAIQSFYVPDYLEKETIIDKFKYDGPFEYDSVAESRKTQQQKILSLIENGEYISKLNTSNDKNATSFIWSLKDEYERKVNEALEEDEYNATLIKTAYQRFLFKTYNDVKEEYNRIVVNRKDDYKKCVSEGLNSTDLEQIEEIIDKVAAFADYPDADKQINLLKERVQRLRSIEKDKDRRNRLESFLNEGYEYLRSKEYKKADDSFIKALAIEKESVKAHLGLLMVENKVSSLDELTESYKKRYSKDEEEQLQALEADFDHIEEQCEKCCVPDYLTKEEIYAMYDYGDFYYDSVLESRKSARQQFLEEIKVNQTLSWLEESRDSEVVSFLNDLKRYFDQRVEEAEKLDEANASAIKIEYQRFLYRTYTKVKTRQNEALEERKSAFEALLNEYEKTDSIEGYKKLISKFSQFGGYDRADKYIQSCRDRIHEISEKERKEKQKEQLNLILALADDFLKEKMFAKADEQYLEVINMDPDNVKAAFGLMMVDTQTQTVDELKDHYIHLYEIDSFVKKKIDGINENYTEEKIQEYTVPDYLSEDTIRLITRYDDLYYDSCLDSRIAQKKMLVDDLDLNASFRHLREIEDPEALELYNSIIEVYDTRINEAEENERKISYRLRNQYNSFIDETNNKLDKLLVDVRKEQHEKQEEIYENNITMFNEDLDKEGLLELQKRFEFNSDYKESSEYIRRIKRRIELIEEKEKKAKIAAMLEDAFGLLTANRYQQANEAYRDVLDIEPDNHEAHEGLLLAGYNISSTEDLSGYFEQRYDNPEKERLSAGKPDENHISRMVKRYTIPAYFDRPMIEQLYDYDFSYKSELPSRIKLNEKLLKDISENKELQWLINNDDQFAKFAKDMKEYFNERIEDARSADKEQINKINRAYRIFLRERDNEVQSLYRIHLIEKREDDERERQRFTKEEEKAETVKQEITETVTQKVESVEQRPVTEQIQKPVEVPKTEKTDTQAIETVTEPIKEIKLKEKKPLPFVNLIKKIRMPDVSTLVIIGCLILVGVFGYFKLVIPSTKYNEAMALYEDEDYDGAVEILKELGRFKHSDEMIEEINYNKAMSLYKKGKTIEALNVLKNCLYEDSYEQLKKIKDDMLKKAKVGDTVVFGEYDQDNDSTNGREYIEWIVLKQEDGNLLLLSKYGLDAQKFNTGSNGKYWDTSYIRSWLNGRFAGNAFDNEKPTMVLSTTLTNYRYPIDDEEETIYIVDRDEIMVEYETEDRIFLLSTEEVEELLPTTTSRVCPASETLKEQSISIDDKGNCDWWLRSVGIAGEGTVAYVWSKDGSIPSTAPDIVHAVRPAMWIKGS